MKNKTAQFANAGQSVTTLVEISNDIKIGEDGWAQIAPFGDFPGMALVDDGSGGMRREKAIQRIDKAAATNMVTEFKNCSIANRYLIGTKIFKGHPDVPGYEKKYPDKSPVGVFADLAVRDDGFYGQPVFTNEGDEARKTLRAFSGRWNADFVAEENGTKVYSPSVLISAGLTDRPNLPVQLLNEADAGEPTQSVPTPAERAEALSKAAHGASADAHEASRKAFMSGSAADHIAAFHAHSKASQCHTEACNCHVGMSNADIGDSHADHAEDHQGWAIRHARLAKKGGADMANDKTLAEAADKPEPEDLEKKIVTLANEIQTGKSALETAVKERGEIDSALQAAKAQVTVVEKARDEAAAKVATIENERNTARTDFANERKGHIDTILAWAIRHGKISYAEKETYRARLAVPDQKQFSNEATILLQVQKTKMNVEPVTVDRANQKVQLTTNQDRKEFMNSVIDQICKDKKWDRKNDYDKAYREFCRAYPALLGEQPEIQYRRNGAKK